MKDLTPFSQNNTMPPIKSLRGYAMSARVYEYRRGSWCVRVSWAGLRIQIYSYIDGEVLDEKLAERLAIRINSEIDSNTFDPARYSPKKPFAFSKAYEIWHKNLTCGEDTKRHYDWTAKRWILPFWTNQDVRDIRGIHIQEFYAQLKDSTLSSKSIRNILGQLHAILTFHSDSLSKMPKFPVVTVQTPSIKPLSPVQQDEIFKYLETQDLPIFTFLRHTGVRPSEACALQRDCLDWKEGKIYIKRSMGERSGHIKPTTKTKKVYVRYITPEIEWTLKGTTVPFVFMRLNKHTKEMIPYNTDMLQYHWAKACKKAGKKVKLNEAHRHSFITQRVAQGIPIDRIQKLTGHTTIKSLQRYIDYNDSLRDVQRGQVVAIGVAEGLQKDSVPAKR